MAFGLKSGKGSEQARPAGEMTLIEHLTELRQRIIKSVIAVAMGGVVCFIFYDRIFDALVKPYCDALENLDSEQDILGECVLVLREPLEGFSLVLTVAAYGGIMLAIPVILWQLWHFVVPGLYPHEKKYALPFVFTGVVLFFTGAGLAYWSIPRALDFLFNFGGDNVAPFLGPGPYLAFIIKMLVGFGLGFQFPLILVLLQLIGVVTSNTAAKWSAICRGRHCGASRNPDAFGRPRNVVGAVHSDVSLL